MTRTIQPSLWALCGMLAAAALGNDLPPTAATSAVDSAAPAPGSTRALEDIYEGFASVGMFDPKRPNEEVNRLILQGIVSDSPRIVELTIRAMGAHAISLAFSESHSSVPVRDFAAVPGLKQFLIGYWHDKIATEGFVHQRPQRAGESSLRSESNPWVEVVDSAADWLTVPRVLATTFPGDEDVHEIIWEMHPYLGSSAARTLSLLNSGRFRTPEADKLRIDSLAAEDAWTLREAADGIAISKPQGGLDALGSAVRGDPAKAYYLIDAIVSYGPEAIPLIKDIPLKGLPPAEQLTIISGLERLKAVARSTP